MDKKIAKPEIVLKEINDSHYYWVDGVYMPSVTHILHQAAPTGDGLINFFLNNTPESAEKIKNDAADFGTLIHKTIERLLIGEEIDLKAKLPDGKPAFSERAKKYLMNFHDWFHEYKPTDVRPEQVIASKKYRYAGTLDLVCTISAERAKQYDPKSVGEERWLVDFKTSSAIYYNYELQLAAYKQAWEELYGEPIHRTFVLRLGSKHKVGYEFKETKRKVEDFMRVYNTWLDLSGGTIPDPPTEPKYPDKIKLFEPVETSVIL